MIDMKNISSQKFNKKEADKKKMGKIYQTQKEIKNKNIYK